MTRLLPYPVLAIFIFISWLAVAERVTPGQLVLAILAATLGTWMMTRLRLPRIIPRRPRVMLRLFYFVTTDIIRSNLAVAHIILGRSVPWHSNFLVIPLEMRNRTGLALLACIITATPGTIWVSYDNGNGRLMLHILDLVDEQEWIDIIKNRYERLLMEIFE